MKRVKIEMSRLKEMVKQEILNTHKLKLLEGKTPIIKVYIDIGGAHVMMSNVKGDLD